MLLVVVKNSTKTEDKSLTFKPLMTVLRQLWRPEDIIVVSSYDEYYKKITSKGLTSKVAGYIATGSDLRANEASIENLAKHLHLILQAETHKVPVIGICYGHQLIGKVEGASVESGKTLINGAQPVKLYKNRMQDDENIFKYMPTTRGQTYIYAHHYDYLTTVPRNYHVIAKHATRNIIYGIKHDRLPIYGVQFHAEIGNTALNFFRGVVSVIHRET